MMKKTWKKILALLCVVSIVCVGKFWSSIKTEHISSHSDTTDTNSTNSIQQDFRLVDGEYITKAGKTEYKLLIPTDAGELIQVAATEFNMFFEEATGLSLTVVTEVSGADKFISIGQTAALSRTDITYKDSELGQDGYKIVTKDDDVYLIGGSDHGSLYAVYGLLECLIDYDYFAENCYTVTKKTEVPLYDFQLKDVPDIAIRTASDGVVSGNEDTLRRMRLRKLDDDFIKLNHSIAHNSLEYVQWSSDSNWRWYDRTNATQLCYTAKGDSDEYQKMLKASFATMKDALMKNTKCTTMTFSPQDNNHYCSCQACLDVISTYGSISATLILYVNDLYEMVSDWFETEEGQPYARDLKIVITAYREYEDVPVKKNSSTGKYEGKNGLAMAEGVYCMYAPILVDYYSLY